MLYIIFICLFINLPTTYAKSYKDKVIVIDESFRKDGKWKSIDKSEEGAIRKLLIYALKSKTAKKIIRKAKRKAARNGQTLLDVIEAGEGSLTDTTLIRKFSASNPEHIIYETKSKVILNRDLNFYDGVLDLIHELVHYSSRKAFNPYTSSFSLDEFVESTISGKGGEVDAYLTECKVLKELFNSRFTSYSNCSLVTDKETGRISKSRGINQFFHVGKYYLNLKKELGSLKTQLRKGEASFISSAYGVPYPLAAVYEFQSIMSKACHNDKKRLEIIKNKQYLSKLDYDRNTKNNRNSISKLSRVPASQFEKLYHSRCSEFI